MSNVTKGLYGFLFILIATTTTFYIALQGSDVLMKITQTSSTFYVNESGNLIVAGVENVYIYNGTKKLSPSLKEPLQSSKDGSVITLNRRTHYNNVLIDEYYKYDISRSDVESFPISHEIRVVNASGLILQYEVSKLDYYGVSRDAVSPERFGYKMNVEWQEGSYYNKLIKSFTGTKLVVKYKLINDSSYYVRLFDPWYNSTSNSDYDNAGSYWSGLNNGSSTVSIGNRILKLNLLNTVIFLDDFKDTSSITKWVNTTNISINYVNNYINISNVVRGGLGSTTGLFARSLNGDYKTSNITIIGKVNITLNTGTFTLIGLGNDNSTAIRGDAHSMGLRATGTNIFDTSDCLGTSCAVACTFSNNTANLNTFYWIKLTKRTDGLTVYSIYGNSDLTNMYSSCNYTASTATALNYFKGGQQADGGSGITSAFLTDIFVSNIFNDTYSSTYNTSANMFYSKSFIMGNTWTVYDDFDGTSLNTSKWNNNCAVTSNVVISNSEMTYAGTGNCGGAFGDYNAIDTTKVFNITSTPLVLVRFKINGVRDYGSLTLGNTNGANSMYTNSFGLFGNVPNTMFRRASTDLKVVTPNLSVNTYYWALYNWSSGFINVTIFNGTENNQIGNFVDSYISDVNYSGQNFNLRLSEYIGTGNLSLEVVYYCNSVNCNLPEFTNGLSNYSAFISNLTASDTNVTARVSANNGLNWSEWFNSTRNNQTTNLLVQGNQLMFQLNLTGTSSYSPTVSAFGIVNTSLVNETPINYTVNFSINGFTKNLLIELGSLLNFSANITPIGSEVCIDFNHPSYGNNYSCDASTTNFTANVTYMRTITFNDSSSSKTINSSSNTFYVQSHQYDEPVGLLFNITNTGSTATDVKVYLNNSFVRTIGNIYNTSSYTLTSFNDSASTYNADVLTDQSLRTVGYLRIPKNVNVTGAVFMLNGTNKIINTFPDSNYVMIEASSFSVSTFNTSNTFVYNFTDPIFNTQRYLVYSNASSVALKRAAIIGSLSYGTTGSDGRFLSTYMSGVTSVESTYWADYNRKTYFTYDSVSCSAHGISGSTKRGISTNMYLTSLNTNLSGWSYVYDPGDCTGTNCEAFYYQPTGTVVNSNGNELFTDTSGDDIFNKTNVTTYVKAVGTKFDSYSAFVYTVIISNNTLTNYSISQVTANEGNPSPPPCDFIHSFVDYYTRYGIPAMEKWKYYRMENPYMQVGILDTSYEWNYTGLYNGTNVTSDFKSSINSYLSTCTEDSDGFCLVPVYFYSDSYGRIQIENIQINYTYNINPVSVPVSNIQYFLNRSTNYTSLPIKVNSSNNGSFTINDIKYDYRGGNKTYVAVAHNTDYSVNITYNLTFVYSDWKYNLPLNTRFVEFIPQSSTAKNVTPYRQTTLIPIFNITTTNYGGLIGNFSVRINQTDSCINWSVSNYNTKYFNNLTYTYQEHANSSSFEGSWFNSGNAVDGNWGTFGFGGSGISYLYENYTKIPTSTQNSLWTVEIGDGGAVNTFNVSLTSCWDVYDDKIAVRHKFGGLSDVNTYSQCYNGSDWQTLAIGGGTMRVYEDAMNWRTSFNLILSTNQTILFTDKDYLFNQGLWMWADYGCNTSSYLVKTPKLLFQACAKDADICETG